MSSWLTMGYRFGLRSIESAYSASRKVLEEDRDRAADELRSYASRYSDKSEKTEEDEMDHRYMDHVIDLAYEADTGLRLIQEAFALTLYHFWKKEISRLLGISGKKADHKAIVGALKEDGQIKPDFDALELLRKITITIKHGNGYELYRAAPHLFSENVKELGLEEHSGWHLFLQIGDADVLAAIEAVRSSAPDPGWSRLGSG